MVTGMVGSAALGDDGDWRGVAVSDRMMVFLLI
jgi:hypothetical protein